MWKTVDFAVWYGSLFHRWKCLVSALSRVSQELCTLTCVQKSVDFVFWQATKNVFAVFFTNRLESRCLCSSLCSSQTQGHDQPLWRWCCGAWHFSLWLKIWRNNLLFYVVPKLGHGMYVKPGPGFPNMVLYMLVGNNNEAKVVCCLPSKEVKNSLRCTLTPVM